MFKEKQSEQPQIYSHDLTGFERGLQSLTDITAQAHAELHANEEQQRCQGRGWL